MAKIDAEEEEARRVAEERKKKQEEDARIAAEIENKKKMASIPADFFKQINKMGLTKMVGQKANMNKIAKQKKLWQLEKANPTHNRPL